MKFPLIVNGRTVVGEIALPSRNKPQTPQYQLQPSYAVLSAYRAARPLYEYSNGVMSPSFEKVDIWRENGMWAGFYITVVTSGLESWTERYVLQHHGGRWMELRQFNVRGTRRRLLGVA